LTGDDLGQGREPGGELDQQIVAAEQSDEAPVASENRRTSRARGARRALARVSLSSNTSEVRVMTPLTRIVLGARVRD
jgi:hypothetical protein